jgi:drug/metabolite transporter (DMT)-like permease
MRAGTTPGGGLVAYAALAVGTVCIGFSAVLVKVAGVPGVASGFYRVAVAAACLVPVWLLRRRPIPARPAFLAAASGLWYALDLATWNTSLLLTSAANATLLANLAPLWVGLWSAEVLRERLGRPFWVAMGIALAGTAIVLDAGGGTHTLGKGDLLAIAASGFYAGYMLTAERARSRLDTVSFVTLSTVVSAALLWAASVATAAPLTGYSGRTWAALLAMGLVSQLGGWLAISYALGHVRAAHVSLTLLGQPVVTAILAVPLLGEALKAHQVVGGLLVLAAIGLVHRRH